MENLQAQVFATLERSLRELKIECHAVDGGGAPQIGSTLRALVPVSHSDDRKALIEVALADFGEEMCFLQFYSTLIMECAREPIDMLDAINDLNFNCPIGSFGVFTQNRQLYHKYCIMFDTEDDAESVSENALLAFHAILIVLAQRAELISGLA